MRGRSWANKYAGNGSLATALADRYYYSDFEALAFDAGAFFLNFKE